MPSVPFGQLYHQLKISLGKALLLGLEVLVAADIVHTVALEATFFKPPYVGVRGWIGIELDRIGDEDLSFHIQVAWELIAPKGSPHDRRR